MNKVKLVDSGASARGFFSTMNLVLISLLYCKENELVPVIDSSVLSLYGSNKNKIRPFSEFFGNTYHSNIECEKTMEIDFVFNNNYINHNESIVLSKLATLNNILMKGMSKELKQFIEMAPVGYNCKTDISVHYRGCDYLKNVPKNHIKNYEHNEFLNKIDNLIKDKKIFVATDDSQIIRLLEARNYQISYFKDVIRGGPGKGSHFKNFFERLGFGDQGKQKRKGFEVVRDVHYLSKNNTYIGTNSNLMYYSKILNIEQKQININSLNKN